jgi:hypothetical protein
MGGSGFGGAVESSGSPERRWAARTVEERWRRTRAVEERGARGGESGAAED